MTLTPAEQDLCAQIDFDSTVAELLKAATNESVEQLQGTGPDGSEWVPVAGLSAKAEEKAAPQVATDLEPQLPPGYIAFYSKRTMRGEYEVDVIKTTDRLDIVRLKATAAGNDDMDNGDVIARLQQWQQLCKFNVRGAWYDWIFIEFETLPDDLDAFGKDIDSFCPDTIGQNFGCMGEMAEAMEEMGQELPPDLKEMMEGLDWDDSDAAGMEMLKRSLQRNKVLFLWWD